MMGFDALVINRIPDEEMDIAKANKSELNRIPNEWPLATPGPNI